MKFLSIWKPAVMEEPDGEMIQKMGALIGEMSAAGVLLDTGGVTPEGTSLRIKRAGNDLGVTDGPFAETKELIGGYAVLNVKSREELLAWTKRFMEVAGDGTSEVYQLAEM